MSSGNTKQLYRGRDGLLGGVCSGIAHYCGIDVSLIRVLTVVLAVLTDGTLALAYAILWLVLSEEPETNTTVDTGVAGVESSTKGGAAASTVPHAADPSQHKVSEYVLALIRTSGNHSVKEHALVSVGFVCFCALFTAALFSFVHVFAAGDFNVLTLWPIVLVLFGITRMAVPGPENHKMDAFVFGLLLVVVGLVLVAMPIGSIYYNFDAWMNDWWPMLLVIVGCIVFAVTFKSPLAKLCAGIVLSVMLMALPIAYAMDSVSGKPAPLIMSIIMEEESPEEFESDHAILSDLLQSSASLSTVVSSNLASASKEG